MIALIISVTAISSVTFLADRLQKSFSQKAHEMIASDLIVRGDHPIDEKFQEKSVKNGLQTANTVIFSTMMRYEQESKLVSLKAVSSTYPLRGKLTLRYSNENLVIGSAWIDQQLADIYQIKIGDEIALGEKKFKVSNFILQEPDRGAGFMNFAPRVMIHYEDLEQTKLLGLGSRATYRLLIAENETKSSAMSSVTLKEFQSWAQEYIQENNIRGISIENIENGQPLVRKTIDQANRFLSLVALLTGMIAAVGIALASRRYAKKQVTQTVVRKCFGASGYQILKGHIYVFFQIMLISSFIGLTCGYFLQEVLVNILQNLMDKNLPSPSGWPILWGFLVSFVLLIGFSFPPLYALTQVSPSVALRKENIVLKFNYLLSAGLGLMSYFLLLLWIANNVRLSLIVLGGFIVAYLVFIGCAFVASRLVGKYLSQGFYVMKGIRYAAQRISGSPFWVSFQISALGVAMLALLLLIVIRFNVLESWQASIPPNANNRFIINVLPEQKAEVESLLKSNLEQTDFDSYPMIRGRLVTINQREIRASDFSDANTQRLVEREFNLSYSKQVPVKNKLIAGKWFDQTDPHQVSMESGIMKSIGLKIGDELDFDIAGTVYKVKISSVRKLDWNSLRVNFFAMMPEELLKDAPQSWIMAFRQENNQRIDMDIIQRFPNITAVNVDESLSQAQGILKQLIFAIQVLFLFTLLAGAVVLMISLVSVQEQRMNEVAILKTLGADQTFLQRVWLFELLTCGGIAGILSGIFASFAGWYLSNYLLEVEMSYPFWIVFCGVFLGIGINWLVSFWLRLKTLNTSPMMILKS